MKQKHSNPVLSYFESEEFQKLNDIQATIRQTHPNIGKPKIMRALVNTFSNPSKSFMREIDKLSAQDKRKKK